MQIDLAADTKSGARQPFALVAQASERGSIDGCCDLRQNSPEVAHVA